MLIIKYIYVTFCLKEVCLFIATAYWGIKQGDIVCFSGLTRNYNVKVGIVKNYAFAGGGVKGREATEPQLLCCSIVIVFRAVNQYHVAFVQV